MFSTFVFCCSLIVSFCRGNNNDTTLDGIWLHSSLQVLIIQEVLTEHNFEPDHKIFLFLTHKPVVNIKGRALTLLWAKRLKVHNTSRDIKVPLSLPITWPCPPLTSSQSCDLRNNHLCWISSLLSKGDKEGS